MDTSKTHYPVHDFSKNRGTSLQTNNEHFLDVCSRAEEDGKLNKIKNLIQEGFDVKTKLYGHYRDSHYWGKTVIHAGFEILCKAGHLDCVKYLSTIDESLLYDSKIISATAYHGKLNVTKFFAEKTYFFKLTMAEFDEWKNPLMQAARTGHHEILEYLLSNDSMVKYLKSLVNDLKDESLFNPVVAACDSGHLDTLKVLMRHLDKDIYYHPRLMVQAARLGHINIIKHLVANGAKIDVQDNEPLIVASKNHQLETVKYLIEQGADVNTREGAALREADEYYPYRDMKCAKPRYETLTFLMSKIDKLYIYPEIERERQRLASYYLDNEKC